MISVKGKEGGKSEHVEKDRGRCEGKEKGI